MNDYDDEDTNDVATDSSANEEEMIRRAYLDAKNALLSEESNAVACFQRVLDVEEKKGSKTVWGFKALKCLVVANIQANDFDTAAGHYARLLEYSGVVSSAVMEPALDEITALVQGSKAALTFCQETYNIRKPTMTWMARCITLLDDVRNTQSPELLPAALGSASELRIIISHAAHVDDASRQSHLLMLMESIEAITAELRFRRRDFETVYSMYRQLEEKSPTNPGAVAAINGKAL
ncbi:PCI domain-containing protein [Aphelenchoides avenae]|nr:PCI domain-containing protein [Aphelenchus avenae]